MFKKVIVIAAAFLALAWAGHARAADCAFNKETSQLQDIKGKTDMADKELALRKEILYGILDCLSTSTQSIWTGYDSLQYIQPAQNLRSRFADEVKGNLFYYDEKRKEVETADLGQTKLVAKEILDWKKSHEDDLARASYFLLWAKNQDILSRANDRAGQISDLKLSPKNLMYLNNAQSSLVTANDLNSSAQQSFEKSDPPADTLALIRQSLQKMFDSYRYFIRIGDSQN